MRIVDECKMLWDKNVGLSSTNCVAWWANKCLPKKKKEGSSSWALKIEQTFTLNVQPSFDKHLKFNIFHVSHYADLYFLNLILCMQFKCLIFSYLFHVFLCLFVMFFISDPKNFFYKWFSVDVALDLCGILGLGFSIVY